MQERRCCHIWTPAASRSTGRLVSVHHITIKFIFPTCKQQYFCVAFCVWRSPPASCLGGSGVHAFNIFCVALLGNRRGVLWPWVHGNDGRQLTETQIEMWGSVLCGWAAQSEQRGWKWAPTHQQTAVSTQQQTHTCYNTIVSINTQSTLN